MMKITFLNPIPAGSSYTPDLSSIYVSFAAAASDMTYGSGASSESINFSSSVITYDDAAGQGTSYGTSKAYSLAEISANGLTLNSATSLVGFISYGAKTGIELLPTGAQPNFLGADTPRYSVFEISYDGTGGGADITNISQFGGAIQLAFLNGSTVQSWVGNTLTTTPMFQALAAASGFTGSTSTTAVYLDANGLFQRVIGTNVFPNGPTQNPYPGFNAYLQSLYGTDGSTTSLVSDLTNLAPGQPKGGSGATGIMSAASATHVTPSATYNLDYHFTATLTQVTPPDPQATPPNPNGTYSVTLKGHVNATAATAGTAITSHTYKNLSITIDADDLVGGNLYMSNFIYQAATSGAGISVSSAGWDDLNTDFGSANVQAALLLKAAGDFAEGMTTGMVGSPTLSDSNPKKSLGSLTSYEWWQNPTLAYAPAQLTAAYYSPYGAAVSANSGGLNGSAFSRGGVYGAPYDDRFSLNLISPDGSTDTMQITLLEDGLLTPAKSPSA